MQREHASNVAKIQSNYSFKEMSLPSFLSLSLRSLKMGMSFNICGVILDHCIPVGLSCLSTLQWITLVGVMM